MFSPIPLPISLPAHYLPILCFAQAPGVAEFYDALYRHWDGPLRALHVQRLERAKLKGCRETEVEVIPDDDGADLEALEIKSLEQAKKGIVVEGVIVIDGDEPVESMGGKSKVGEKETTAGGEFE